MFPLVAALPMVLAPGLPCAPDDPFLQDVAEMVPVAAWPTSGRERDARADRLDAQVRAAAVGPDGALWAATDRGLGKVDGAGATLIGAGRGALLSDDVRDVAVDGVGMVWLATDKGVSVFDGHGHWLRWTGRQGLPIEDVRCLLLAGNGDRWFGTSRGVCRLRDGRFSYFAGRRWLPDDSVLELRAGESDVVFVRTATGYSRIASVSMTLEGKAEAFLKRLRERHVRFGYVTDCSLREPGDTSSFVHEASDNDGLWTALYIAAESFRYAATRDHEARRNARESMEALLRLESLTTIPGFPARAVVRKDEEVLPSGGEWHDSPDGEWLWKGDTSSDELDGHYYAWTIYYDLVADHEDKERIRATVARVTDHLLANDYTLIDVDGKPTRWAVFGPRKLNDDPEWFFERGLNSLSILSHLKVAHHITGDPRYEEAYLDLIREHGYLLNLVDQKITILGEVNHSDDELSFVCYYPILMLEHDPEIRALLLASVERSWQTERPERNPWFNFIYGAGTGRLCDIDDSMRTLREIPMDLVSWRMENSRRADIALDKDSGRFDEAQSRSVLPYGERAMFKWNGNPYSLDGGGDGRGEDDGAFYLLPYWMGRYFGFIR